ncbi:tetratricopeptide repeat protein, partial [Candidatus Poribacteria bacterium]|nr:tetratricopeptide repeat protein [Candidatus Poribacteria bacterium]
TLVNKQNPGAPQAWFQIGNMQRLEGKTREALESYKTAVELRAKGGLTYPQAHVYYALMLKNVGDLAGAEREFRKLLEREPEENVALINLGWLVMQDFRRFAEGVDLAEKGIALKPDAGIAWFMRGEIARVRLRFDEAIPALRKAMELGDEDGGYFSAAALTLGAALRDSGDLEGAERQFREIIQHEPDNWGAIVSLGVVLNRDAKTRPEAIRLFERGIELNPGDYTSYVNAAGAYQASSDLERARDRATRAHGLRPDLKVVQQVYESVVGTAPAGGT